MPAMPPTVEARCCARWRRTPTQRFQTVDELLDALAGGADRRAPGAWQDGARRPASCVGTRKPAWRGGARADDGHARRGPRVAGGGARRRGGRPRAVVGLDAARLVGSAACRGLRDRAPRRRRRRRYLARRDRRADNPTAAHDSPTPTPAPAPGRCRAAVDRSRARHHPRRRRRCCSTTRRSPRPFDGSFPRGDLRHHLVVRAPGYRTEAQWITFDGDRALDRAQGSARRARRSASRRHDAEARPPPATSREPPRTRRRAHDRRRRPYIKVPKAR